MTSAIWKALSAPSPNSRDNCRPASPVFALTPSSCWNVRMRNPSKPALRSARRNSPSYMPNRQGPQPPAVKKT